MKVRYLGATPEEDKVVEIPEGATEIVVPAPEAPRSVWPSVVFFIALMAFVVLMTWTVTRG